MTSLRRALARIALTWLLCQAAVMPLGPLAFALEAPEAAQDCRCSHGDHEACPMQHKPAPGSRVCIMTAAGAESVAVFSWLLHTGLVPPAAAGLVFESRSAVLPADDARGSHRTAPPDPPPPRL